MLDNCHAFCRCRLGSYGEFGVGGGPCLPGGLVSKNPFSMTSRPHVWCGGISISISHLYL